MITTWTKRAAALPSLSAILLLAGCGGVSTTAGAPETPIAPAATIAVRPAAATVPAGATLSFGATVENAAASTVTFSLDEASGCGTITPGGRYTAPATPPAGPCHVRATVGGVFDVATVTCTAAGSCGNVGVDPAATDTGFGGTFHGARYAWYDRTCSARSAFLVDNDALDPGRSHGGYLYRYVFDVDGVARDAHGTMSSDLKYGGFGFVINHCGVGGFSSYDATGTHAVVWAGEHHAIHEFKYRTDLGAGGSLAEVTVQWLFATGRDAPLYLLTYDLGALAPGAVTCDSRAPYGSLTYDGVDGRTGGVGWGDSYRFRTTDTLAMSLDSPWDYRAPNTVPHSMTWAYEADAEMGVVGTQTVYQHPAGFDYGGVRSCRGLASTDDASRFGNGPGLCRLSDGHLMPYYPDWTYQNNAWNISSGQKAKKVTWATPVGAVGFASYAYTPWGSARASGHPYQSYSLYVVLGKRSAGAIDAQVAQVEAVQGATLTASVGEVVTHGPAGVARADLVAYAPPGWNHVHGTWDVRASAGHVTAALALAGATLDAPMFRVHGWTAAGGPSRVTLNGAPLAAGTGYFASVDAARQLLWITLAGTHTGVVTLDVE